MERLIAGSPESRSLDLAAVNLARIQALFPDAVVEGRLEVEALRLAVGEPISEGEERYGLTWHGKRRARQLALTPSTGTLRPRPEESLDWDTTRNLVIEGDNLEVLKLLQKPFAGRVKLIYIDPPYNTGRDFVYPDSYQDTLRNYLEVTGQAEEGARISSNTEASGRFHTDWLNMMLPRLRLAHSLLQPAGTLLASCDDNEMPRLRLLLDELFGEENFVAQLVWQRSRKGDAKLIATVHEYVLCYARDKEALLEAGIWRKPKEGADEVLAHYRALRARLGGDHAAIREAMQAFYRGLPEGDPRRAHRHYNWSDDRGLYFAADFAGPDDGRASRPRHDILHPVTGRPCKKPSTGWRWDQAKTDWALAQVPPRIHFGPDETTIPTRKSYLEEIDSEPFSSVFYRDGRSATLEVEALVGKGWFPFPKNTDVLAELIALATGPEDLVLDFFAGSGSTGHAVWKLNAGSGSARRFILVQLPEPTGREPYRTIADITRRRLREAAAQLRAGGARGDLGFRAYRLDTSNLRAWNPRPDDLAGTLFEATDNLVEGRTPEDLLAELFLKLGFDPATPVATRAIAGHTVHSAGGGLLMACLDAAIGADYEALAQGIADWRSELSPAGETTLVFRDGAFADDVAKTNLTAILAQRGLSHVRSL